MSALTEIGMLVTQTDGTSVQAANFAPLVRPTSDLLGEIASAGGPVIPPEDIVAKIVGVPLFTMDKTFGVGLRVAIESSANPAHAAALQDRRIAEIQTLFNRFAAAPQDQRNQMLARVEFHSAARLVLDVLETAAGFAQGGPATRYGPGYVVKATVLQKVPVQ
jgi:hypothetical protein